MCQRSKRTRSGVIRERQVNLYRMDLFLCCRRSNRHNRRGAIRERQVNLYRMDSLEQCRTKRC